jgi:hypothetical protein
MCFFFNFRVTDQALWLRIHSQKLSHFVNLFSNQNTFCRTNSIFKQKLIRMNKIRIHIQRTKITKRKIFGLSTKTFFIAKSKKKFKLMALDKEKVYYAFHKIALGT